MTYRAIVAFVVAAAVPLAAGLGCSSGTPMGNGLSGTGGTGGASTGTGGSSGMTGGSASGGSNPTGAGGTPGTGGAGGRLGPGGTAGAVSSGGRAGGTAGSAAGTGGGATGGRAGGGGTGTANGGVGGGPSSSADCSSAGAIITFPPVPSAPKSPLYTVTANGTSQFVEKLTKFSAEMQVHYAYFGVATGCTATVAVTLSESFSSYTVSPKSRNISATKSGNTITFSSGPNYLILQFDSKELLFILIDDQEASPPQLGDANVKNIADYTVDNTGATLVTSKVQSAINAASGAAQNVLYFPPGRYKVGELSLKSNMTMYLAGGAMLDGSTNTSDYAATGTPPVESTSHGLIHMYNVTNTKLLGRGVIDAEGTAITGGSNDTPSFKINAVRIDQSSKVLIDGVLVRDPVFWNTLIYKSDQITIQNYKVINRRPTTTTYNQTDGIDFDASTNGTVFNAFVYSGDDNLSPKTEQEGGIDTKNIVYQKAVLYSNSGACKVGTKTFGTTMDGIVFKDIDIVKAGRALVIDANDTAVIQNTKFENIRIEAADSHLIDLEEDAAPTWRTAPNTSVAKDTYFTNVSADVKKSINIHGKSSTVTINGVHFSGFTVQGKPVTSQTDADASWSVNQYVSNITFQ